MLRKALLIACVLGVGLCLAWAQPPEGPPPGPHLFIPLPPDTELPPPPPEGSPEEFLDAAIGAIDSDGDGLLSADEIHAAHEAVHGEKPPEGEEPPPEGEPPPGEPPPEGPPPGEMPPPPMGLIIPLPEDFEPPPPEEGPDVFIEAAFSVVAGEDLELTLEELKAILPPPEEMPPPPEEGKPMKPHLFVPFPEDFEPPPPEEGPDVFIEAAFGAIAGDDLVLTLEELKAALPPPGEMGPPGISEGEEGLEGLPYPPECGDEVRDSELLPQAENVSCDRSESVGNLIFRTVCNTAPYETQAISLPEGRAADCFGIEAIKGHNIVFEIVKESDGTQRFHTAWGKMAFDTLVLVGEPGGTVYLINLLSADEPDARITVKFIDHPTF